MTATFLRGLSTCTEADLIGIAEPDERESPYTQAWQEYFMRKRSSGAMIFLQMAYLMFQQI